MADWSVIIATRGRREELGVTLHALAEHPAASRLEVIVADNASEDGTAAAVRGFARRRPGLAVRVIERGDANPCAGRNQAAAASSGQRLLFLDDDSTPRPGTLAAAAAALASDPRLGAVGGPVHLPGGGQDACALPALSPACGWAVRREAFERVGGFDAGLFMQAEELGLACRLLAAGWSVAREEAVAFDHRKAATARRSLRAARLDLRNNLALSAGYLEPERAAAARPGLVERYGRLLLAAGGTGADADAAAAEASSLPRIGPPLPAAAAESLYGFERQRAAVAAFAERERLAPGTPVTLAGFTKHADLTAEAAEAAGLVVAAVTDPAEAFRGGVLHAVPVVAPGAEAASSTRAVLHTDLNPGRRRPAPDPAGRPSLLLRDAYPAVATAG
ncbi:glycosyltransferase family 2 protein [Phycisphaera mikurensis]|uniref:Putative glycosyltransferase n=1 Tax=Phycisphaera mikurensis (strain NBRC 102666 / KCTC 22515 / FYK2301M01) TaxID=1142394 RepID=I0IHF3_PHYMF|nr:glycosyltransferase family A protein [Phycisphaera mikurensis]MBB6440939.1 GT2 family glycosyltransferase [Phycisphaera mikurensis]BAM04691.1 putative glycosyltransferase [Phycisphaera mikurensis NBRC 102666]